MKVTRNFWIGSVLSVVLGVGAAACGGGKATQEDCEREFAQGLKLISEGKAADDLAVQVFTKQHDTRVSKCVGNASKESVACSTAATTWDAYKKCREQ